jgi:hypothetical protein
MAFSQNVYSTELDQDPSLLQVVDIMHDVELGAGKSYIVHVLRLCVAEGGGLIEEFDAQLVLLTLGNSHFSDNAQFPEGPNIWS